MLLLGKKLQEIGVTPSQHNLDMWLKEYCYNYNYITTHIASIIIIACDPLQYNDTLNNFFKLKYDRKPDYFLEKSYKY